jgi:hypothetical protein
MADQQIDKKQHRFDFMQLAANAVPGAVGADILSGKQRDIIIAAVVTAVTATAIEGGQTSGEKELSDYFRKMPLLGFGAGYALCRLYPLPWQSAVLGGLAGGAMMWALYRRRKPPGASDASDTEAEPQFPIMNSEGDPPGAAPAAHEPELMI